MARCQNPSIIRNPGVTRGGQQVPCGKCENCKKVRLSAWSYRLLQEDKNAESSYFLTLTYNVHSVPITRRGFMSLNKRHLQLFFKRLRKAIDRHGGFGQPLKYYAVGEYGGRFNRPHYHVILFNAPLELLIGRGLAGYAQRGFIELDGQTPMQCDLWGYAKKVIKVPTLRYIKSRDEYAVKWRRSVVPAYTLGHCSVGQVSGASVGYTMKYVTKEPEVPKHKNDDRQPEFSLQSEGLGLSYLTPAIIAWHRQDLFNRQYCVLEDGRKIAMPRYYKKHMLTLAEREMLRAWNVLENMHPLKFDNTARERNEALYAGIRRHNKSLKQNQTF